MSNDRVRTMRRMIGFWTLGLMVATATAAGAQQPAGSAEIGSQVASEGGAYTNVTVAELRSMLAQKDFPLVNVHIPFEGDLPGTDLSIPYNEIEQHLELLPADKTSRIVLYCKSGRMSEIAAVELARRGYTNVFNVTGGFIAWAANGLPMEGL